MDEPELPPLPPRSKRSSRLLFESALIVASVALGFLVTEWRERAADRELSRRILTNVVSEIRANREWVIGQIAKHQLRLIDYDIAARLSDIYMFQEEGYGRASRGMGEALFVPETFRPGHAREAASR